MAGRFPRRFPAEAFVFVMTMLAAAKARAGFPPALGKAGHVAFSAEIGLSSKRRFDLRLKQQG